MTELAEPTGVEAEQRGLLGRNLVTAGHLMGHATAFFFLAFLFAYVYLRSLNGNGQFHPRGVNPPVALGTVVAVLLVASAAAVRLALADQRANRHAAVRLKLAAGFALGVGALAAQVAVWAAVGFGPNSGGYASVFVGWTGFYFVFALLTLCWVEAQLATALRDRDHALTGLDALAYYWAFLAGIGVLTWIVLYLVSA
jgi:heme/copper-type cytochrome/quinol oxidase subunit 3